MPQKYFSSFPEVDYTLPDDSRIRLTDVTPGIVSRQVSVDKLSSYGSYKISDGERPDIVSQILYGTPTYAWTFFQINDFLRGGINMWPKSSSELSSFIENKYKNLGIITVDSLTFIGKRDDDDDRIFGSIILFNIEEYASSGSLKLRTIKNGVYSETVRVIGFNRNLLQLIVDTSTLLDFDNFFSGTEFSLTIDDEDLEEKFKSDFQNSHNINIDNVGNITFEILLDINSRPFNWSVMTDAPSSYINSRTGLEETITNVSSTGRNEKIFIVRQADGEEVLSANGERIIAAATPGFIDTSGVPNREVNVSLNPSIRWITYGESEIITNDNNRTIRVIDPGVIRDFAKKYFNVLETI